MATSACLSRSSSIDPRHIEIQVIGDSQGNVIYLGERECSLQRRHQKVIEEAPSPFLDEGLRAEMGQQAVALAQAVQYQSAGTVEFIVDTDRQFLLSGNEYTAASRTSGNGTSHRIGSGRADDPDGAGEPLPVKQEDVVANGWAIEARVYAEDPFRNFLPSIGRLVRYLPPIESAAVRVDTGVMEGGEVSMHYDPMIAKVITHGATRDRAIAHMREALNEFYLRGVSNNISFLAALIEHTRFREARLNTNFIAEEYPDGFHVTDVVHDDPALMISVAASIHRRYMDRAASINGQLKGYERQVPDDWVVILDGQRHRVNVQAVEGGHRVIFGGEEYVVHSEWQFGMPLFRGTLNGTLPGSAGGTEVCLQVERRNMHYRLFHWGAQVDVMVLTARAAELLDCMPFKEPPDMSKYVLSPMPGLLSQIRVDVGNEVKSGQHLAVIEAMKMENVLCASSDGKVAKVLAGVGDTLAVDQPILEFE